MSYSKGVLIHNFNEDRFGQQSRELAISYAPPSLSVSHAAHHWKVPDPQPTYEPAAARSIPAHLLFGHAGDMRDPRTSLSQTEFATASSYFMQDPKSVTGVGHLSADGFTMSNDPKALPYSSHIAAAKKLNWGDGRQSHALTPSDRFMTTSKQFHTGLQDPEPGMRIPRCYGEFTKLRDGVNLTRSTASLPKAGLATLQKP
mmetsp:Transcript_33741/g.101883  ORF Transcript_33741/g.101883 Transcript_33741/m.101883 type:complete len:201 (-) Transcript_33741:136-738(-)